MPALTLVDTSLASSLGLGLVQHHFERRCVLGLASVTKLMVIGLAMMRTAIESAIALPHSKQQQR